MGHRACIRWSWMAVVAMLCFAARVPAQVQVGDDLSLNLAGSVSTGYSASYTNEGSSSHGITFGGNGVLNGSYYSPGFLSFSLSPFYHQSRNNSSYQSISDTTGLSANASIFSGSHFPGYVNFSRSYASEGNYLVPGLTSYKTNGNTQTFGAGWSVNLPKRPSISVGYQQGTSEYSIYGASSGNSSDFYSVFGHASYTIAKFHLNGGVHYSNLSSKYPQLLQDQPSPKINSDSTTYSFNMNRSLGMNGSTWASYTRNDYGYHFSDSRNSLASDVVTGGVALRPARKLGLQFSGDYDDNLAGTLYQTFASAGGLIQKAIPGESSHSWGTFGMAQYTVCTGLYVAGTVSHREQLFLGTPYGATSYAGSANYGHRFLGGQFTAGINVSRSSVSNSRESILGLLSNVNYFRRIGTWDVSGSFNYSQNVQTFLISQTTSGYSYTGSASHRFGKVNWSGSAGGSKSLLTNVAGSNTFSQSYSTGLSGRWLGASAGYSRASGSGVFAGSGISPLPPDVPPPVIPAPIIFYGGTTYSFGAGSTPLRGLTISGNYARTRSNTQNGSLSSNNLTEQGNVFVQYLFRKVYFTAGYSRLLQGFSATGIPPNMVASYYAGVSRWFNFF